jgi:hypothetical protein
MGGKVMRKVIAISFVTAALLVFGAAPATAGSATTTTVTVKDLVETFADVDPCTGNPVVVTTTSNGVFHTTTQDGTSHATFTQAGTFTFVGAGVTGTGQFAIWGGFNVNAGGSVAGTFTFNASGERNGSRFTTHAVEHINATPVGTANFFSKLHFNC